MKKLTALMAVLAVLGGIPAHAQTSNQGGYGMGQAAAAGKRSTSPNHFAWGIGLGSLAVIGTVVGLTVASAVDNGNPKSHTGGSTQAH